LARMGNGTTFNLKGGVTMDAQMIPGGPKEFVDGTKAALPVLGFTALKVGAIALGGFAVVAVAYVGYLSYRKYRGKAKKSE